MNLIIAQTPIRQNADGLYCLNDLHHASGGEKRHAPNEWLRLKQTQEFVEELETTGIPIVTLEGRNGGTFVELELVYAYATWISPKFFLKVIRVFHQTMTGLPVRADALKAQLALAQEVGQLRDAVQSLQGEVVSILKSHVKTSDKCARLQGQVTRLKAAAATQTRIDSAITMLAANLPRAQIVAALGISYNYLRQIAHRARLTGRLAEAPAHSRQGQLAL